MTRTTSAAIALVTAFALVTLPGTPSYAADATVTVDFTNAVTQLDAADYGLDITGYGSHSYITNNDIHRENVRRQGFGVMRMELMYNAAHELVCAGDGCDVEVTGDAWIDAMHNLGAEPMLILPLSGLRTAEQDLADATSIYQHFADRGTTVRKFIVGNELDNGGNPDKMDATEYATRFNQIYDALHALDANVEVGGPALASYEPQWGVPYMDTFLTLSGSRTDFVDYHDYGAGSTRYTPEELLTTVIAGYTSDIDDLRARIARLVPERAGQIPIQIGEWNMDYSDPDGTLMMSHLPTVWGSAALGTMLKSGISTLLYGDKNGNFDKNTGLGITSTEGEGGFGVNTPTPIYHGLGMFTGEGLFRHFGSTMVTADSSNSAVQAFASTGSKNIVLVNTATTATSTNLALTGYGGGAAEVWQSSEEVKENWTPHSVGSQAIAGGGASLTLPARSVTTLVLADQGLKGEYFGNMTLTGTPVLTRVDPTVNFDWGMGSPGPAVAVDGFSVRWTGQVDVPSADAYTFIATTDDGSRLWVDGNLVVDAWTDHSKRDDAGTITLTAGRHDIRFEYYENGYDAIAQLGWSSPNLARETIPAVRLFPAV